MLSTISGPIELKTEKYLVVDTGGVGYKIFASPRTLDKLPQMGETCKLHTHLYVREDAMELYGFLTLAELNFFELLLTISGVGPRVALNILSIASPKELALAIMKEDAAFLTRVAGVGRKIAEKVILELRDKIGKLDFGVKTGDEQLIDSDALDALTALGYSLKDGRDALRRVPPEISGIGNRVKEALRILGRK